MHNAFGNSGFQQRGGYPTASRDQEPKNLNSLQFVQCAVLRLTDFRGGKKQNADTDRSGDCGFLGALRVKHMLS